MRKGRNLNYWFFLNLLLLICSCQQESFLGGGFEAEREGTVQFCPFSRLDSGVCPGSEQDLGSLPSITITFPDQESRPLGYLAKVEGSCTSVDGNVSIRFNDGVLQLDSSVLCSSDSFSTYVDTSTLAVADITLTVSQSNDTGTTSVTKAMVKRSSSCDSSASRGNNGDGLAGGGGTISNPYIICTEDQLNAVRTVTAGASHFYEIRSDIYFENGDTNGDLVINGSDSDYTSGTGWIPLPIAIQGLFGRSHSITGLKINDSSSDNMGLFSDFTGSSQMGRYFYIDLHFYNSDITGKDYVGTLVGASNYYMKNISCKDCKVTGTNFIGSIAGFSGGPANSLRSTGAAIVGQSFVGGLVGDVDRDGFKNMKFQGSITGLGSVGGIAGRAASIYNAYADVDINATGSLIGGIVGRADNLKNVYAVGTVRSTSNFAGCVNGAAITSISNSFAACDTVEASSGGGVVSGGVIASSSNLYYSLELECSQSGGGSCKLDGSSSPSHSDFYGSTHAVYSSWDFRNKDSDGRSRIFVEQTSGFPLLFWETPDSFSTTLAGSGTAASPYQITLASDLVEVSSNPFFTSSFFELTNNIDLSTLGPGEFDGLFTEVFFEGGFDGGGFQVQNLSIDDNSLSSHGLGFIGNAVVNSTINNLHVTVNQLDGGGLLGGIVGRIYTRNSLSELKVSGNAITGTDNYVGGIFGVGKFLSLNKAASLVDVTGHTHVGGIGGDSPADSGDGTTSNVYSTGNITATNERAGGIFGNRTNGTSISNCYSSGNIISAADRSGGIIGRSFESVMNCFSLGNISGSSGTTNIGHILGSGANTGANNYHLSTAVCTNSGAGTCNATNVSGTGIASYFFDDTNAPLTSWDFAGTWTDNVTALPTLQSMP